MLLDNRLIGLNATNDTRDEWARESWRSVELIWSYMILLHFARLLRLDPFVVHVLAVLWKVLPTSVISLTDRAWAEA